MQDLDTSYIVIDTETNRTVLQGTTCHNALMYTEFMNDYGKLHRYKISYLAETSAV